MVRTWAFILSEMMNHLEGSEFLKVNQGYCVVKDGGLVGAGAGVRTEGRMLDKVYCHSPQFKKWCWLGADGRLKSIGGHNLKKELKGFTKAFNTGSEDECQGPDFSSSSNLSALSFSSEFLIIAPQKITNLILLHKAGTSSHTEPPP